MFFNVAKVSFLSFNKNSISINDNEDHNKATEIKFKDLNKLNNSVIKTINPEKIKTVFKINSLNPIDWFKLFINRNKSNNTINTTILIKIIFYFFSDTQITDKPIFLKVKKSANLKTGTNLLNNPI